MYGTWRALQTRTGSPFITKMAVPRPTMLDRDSSPRTE